MKWLDIKTIVATALGGLALLFATIFLASFISSPPTRAEFDSLKTAPKIKLPVKLLAEALAV